MPGCFWRYIMVWFPGVSGFGFRGVSGVCFGVAQGGVLLGGGFWRFWVCFLFWFVRTWGWGFRGCAGFFAGCGFIRLPGGLLSALVVALLHMPRLAARCRGGSRRRGRSGRVWDLAFIRFGYKKPHPSSIRCRGLRSSASDRSFAFGSARPSFLLHASA